MKKFFDPLPFFCGGFFYLCLFLSGGNMDTYSSQDTKELAKALIAVQRDMAPATKDATNRMRSQSLY